MEERVLASTGLRTPLADTATFLGSHDCGGKGVPMCLLSLRITLKRKALWVSCMCEECIDGEMLGMFLFLLETSRPL